MLVSRSDVSDLFEMLRSDQRRIGGGVGARGSRVPAKTDQGGGGAALRVREQRVQAEPVGARKKRSSGYSTSSTKATSSMPEDRSRDG